jgi:hypothetical protein
MAITPRRKLITIIGRSNVEYVTDDGEVFDDLEEAVDHENKLSELKAAATHANYEFVTSIQQAINMAAAEKRVVRFLWSEPNKKIKASIEDLKGCKLMKPDKDSNDVAVVPPNIENFDFNEVK